MDVNTAADTGIRMPWSSGATSVRGGTDLHSFTVTWSRGCSIAMALSTSESSSEVALRRASSIFAEYGANPSRTTLAMLYNASTAASLTRLSWSPSASITWGKI